MMGGDLNEIEAVQKYSSYTVYHKLISNRHNVSLSLHVSNIATLALKHGNTATGTGDDGWLRPFFCKILNNQIVTSDLRKLYLYQGYSL